MENKKNEHYTLNNFRIGKINEKSLITTDHGSWILLGEEESDLFGSGKLVRDSDLYNRLEKKGIIITNKNIKEISEKIREKYSFLFEGTSLHIVIPTLRCNENCVYCHASSRSIDEEGFDMSKETATNIVNFIFQSPSQNITIEFQGGEPLLRFDIVKHITEYAKKLNQIHKKNLKFSIVTNLSMISEEKIKFLLENKVHICTSLDGPDFIHNKNRPLKNNCGTYQMVINGINKIREYQKKLGNSEDINSLTTITRESLKYPKEIINEYLKNNFKSIHLRYLNNLGDARNTWKDISYTPEDFLSFWKKAIDYIIDLNNTGNFIVERTCLIMLKKIFEDKDPNYLDLRSPCGAAIGQLAYTPEGYIYSCDEARMVGEDIFKLGNVSENTFKEIIGSHQTCSIVSASINDCQICDYCVYKPYCGICPVCNYVEQGSVIANIPETPRCKIYKAQFTYIFKKLQEESSRKVFFNWLQKNEKRKEESIPKTKQKD